MFQKPTFIFLILLFLLNTLFLMWLAGRSSLPHETFIYSNPTLSANKCLIENSSDNSLETEGNHKGIRIAHLFLVHDHRTAVGVARILKRIWDPKHTYVIHIDRDNVTFMDSFIA